MAHWIHVEDSNAEPRAITLNMDHVAYVGVHTALHGVLLVIMTNGHTIQVDAAKAPRGHAAILTYFAQNIGPFPTK